MSIKRVVARLKTTAADLATFEKTVKDALDACEADKADLIKMSKAFNKAQEAFGKKHGDKFFKLGNQADKINPSGEAGKFKRVNNMLAEGVNLSEMHFLDQDY